MFKLYGYGFMKNLKFMDLRRRAITNHQSPINVFIPNLINAGDQFNYLLLDYFKIKYNIVRSASSADLLLLSSGLGYLQKSNIAINKKKLHILGSGFLFEEGTNNVLVRPNLSVYALRGFLSKKKLSRIASMTLPDDLPLADTGLLASMFARGFVIKKYEIGFIPHFREQDTDIVKNVLAFNPAMHFIDIKKPPVEVIHQIRKCKTVVSSSLHGLIFSDSLNIPNIHVRLTELPLGGTFKFKDYYSSFGQELTSLNPELLFSITRKQIIQNYKIKKSQVEIKKRELLNSIRLLKENIKSS